MSLREPLKEQVDRVNLSTGNLPTQPGYSLAPDEADIQITLPEYSLEPIDWGEYPERKLIEAGTKGVAAMTALHLARVESDSTVKPNHNQSIDTAASPFNNGIEAEYYLVDSTTGLPTASSGTKLGAEIRSSNSPLKNHVTQEFQSHAIELALPKNSSWIEVHSYVQHINEVAKRLGTSIIGEGVGYSPVEILEQKNTTPEPRYRLLAHALKNLSMFHPNHFDFVIDNGEHKPSSQKVRVSCLPDKDGGNSLTFENPTFPSFQIKGMGIPAEGEMTSVQYHVEPLSQKNYLLLHRTAEILNPAFLGLFASSPLINFCATGIKESRIVLWAAAVHKDRTGNLKLSESGRVKDTVDLNYLQDPMEQFRIAQKNVLMPLSASVKKDIESNDINSTIALANSKSQWPCVRTTYDDGKLRIELRDYPTPPTVQDMLINQRIVEALMVSMMDRFTSGQPIPIESSEYLNQVCPFSEVIRDRERAAAFGLDAIVSAKAFQFGKPEMPLHELWRNFYPMVIMGLDKIGISENEQALVKSVLFDRLFFDRSKIDYPGFDNQGRGVCDADLKLHLWDKLKQMHSTTEQAVVEYNKLMADIFAKSAEEEPFVETHFLKQFTEKILNNNHFN